VKNIEALLVPHGYISEKLSGGAVGKTELCQDY
jgi:hypothetical protein